MERKPENGAAGKAAFKPVLGLSDEPAAQPVRWEAAPGTIFDQPEPEPDQLLELTVIVPARNEEDCLAACLQSLISQSEELFKLGREWELIVVDDHSTDRTAEIARGFAGVTVIGADKLEPAGRARPMPSGRRQSERAGGGCSSPTRTRSTSREICAARCMRPLSTRPAC